MKTLIIFIYLFFLSNINCYSQIHRISFELRLKADDSSATIIDGKMNGAWNLYNDSGDSYINYKDGLKDGYFFRYSKKGIMVEEGCFKKGYLHGIYKTYSNSNGLILTEGTYVDGLLNGIYRTYINGKCNSEITFLNGKKNGLEYSYHPSGAVFLITYNENDSLKAPMLIFYHHKPVIKFIFDNEFNLFKKIIVYDLNGTILKIFSNLKETITDKTYQRVLKKALKEK